MEAVADKMKYTADEYLTFCENHEGRFEFVNGRIIEMSEKTATANRIADNIHRYLGRHLQNEKVHFAQNTVKLRSQDGTVLRIPDFMLFGDSENQIKFATEPLMLVEVVSNSTENTDEVPNLHIFRKSLSLQYYIIVAQDRCLATLYSNEGSRWYVDFFDKAEQIICLPALGIKLLMNKIYKNAVL